MRAKKPNSTPSKQELYARVAELEEQLARAEEEIRQLRHPDWNYPDNRQKAVIAFNRAVKEAYGRVSNAQIDKIDESGYWFSFDVDGYGRQKYVVRHHEI